MKHFVATQGSVYEICCRGGNKLIAKRFDIDVTSGNVTKGAEFSWSCKLKVECLVASDCHEKLTGRRCPFLLVYARSPGSKDRNSDSCCYILCIDIDGMKFVPLRKFKSSRIQFQANLDSSKSNDIQPTFHLLDGPTVLTVQDSNLHIFWQDVPGCHQLKEYFVTLQMPETWELMCCSQVKRKAAKTGEIIGLKCQEELYLAFVKLRTREKCPVHSKQKSKELVAVKFDKGHLACINAGEFIPSEYRVVVTCIVVLQLQIVNSKHTNVIYAGTSDGFVLHLESSVLKRCVSLSSGPVTRLISVPSPSQHLLAFQNGSVVAINSDLKPGANFTDIQCVFQGDFMRNGTRQALLCKDSFSETASWCLTDFTHLCVHSNQVTRDRDHDTQELANSTRSAVSALQARLQREKAALHDTEQLVRERAAFLHESCSRHVTLSAGMEPIMGSQKVDLNPLVDGPDVPDQGGQLSHSYSLPAPEVQVCDVWQRTYRDRWCVAVDVVNKSSRNIQAWLQIVPFGDVGSTAITASSSKPVVVLSSTATCSTLPSPRETKTARSLPSKMETTANSHSSSKRARFMESAAECFPTIRDVSQLCSISSQVGSSAGSRIYNKQTVATVTRVPSFGHNTSYNVHVVLKWKYDDESTPTAEKPPSCDTGPGFMGDAGRMGCDTGGRGSRPVCDGSDRGCIYTINCGSLQLTSAEVVQEVYEVRFDRATSAGDSDPSGEITAGAGDSSGDITMRDLKDSQTDIEAWQLLQRVVHLSLKTTPGISAQLSRMIEERCGFRYNSAYKCFTTEITALRCVQLVLGEPTSTNTRTLDVYHRSERDIRLLVHHLCSRLPDHVIIVPVQPASFRNILPSMLREIHFLSHGLRRLLNDHESQRSVDCADIPENDDDIRKIGEKFKLRKEKMMENQKEDTVNEDLVDDFFKQLSELQVQTDSGMALEGNR